MFKLIKLGLFVFVILVAVSLGIMISQRNTLNEQVIRLHIIADSDDEEAQAIKLEVRDAVLSELDAITANAATKEEAMQRIQQHLPVLQAVANEVLEKAGNMQRAVVSLKEEAFPTRHYDTFSLPAGVYDSLRVTIGSGEGKNWWCVLFPQLCIPAVSTEVADTAVGAGFSEDLSKTLTGENGYEVRFWVLDCMGQIQNFFFNRK